ncbi:MAG: alpha/beta hydrolase-fold protein [Bacteroidota bacterium]
MSIQQIEQSSPEGAADKRMVLTVHASSLKGRGNISCYNAYSEATDLPIVILLHGVYGNHWVWMNMGGAHAVYERLRESNEIDEMLLVMPEDGSYYAGSAYLPLRNGFNYEQWIMEDMLETVLKRVPAASKKSRVYITGLSMGGYGALRLGAKYASRFSGISAHSAITTIEEMRIFVEEDLSIYQCENPNETDVLHWATQHKAQLPPLRMDCGKDDVLYGGNVEFSQQLKAAQIDHTFTTSEGGHEWPYWNRMVEHTLRFFDGIEHQAV